MLGFGAISEFAISEEGSAGVVVTTLEGSWKNVISLANINPRQIELAGNGDEIY